MLRLDGFYDLHIHSAPAPFVRIGDSADIARWCAEAGMAGIVIKSHFESTVSKAYHARLAVREAYPDFKVFSGIALNRGVGGVNPGAVELALQQGAKVVWMPTLDAANHAAAFGAAGTYGFGAMTLTSRRKIKDPLYRVTNDSGKLTDDAKEVVQLVVDYGAILATGHISKPEILATVDFALGVGAKRIVITHPELAAPKLDLPTMVELAKAGCYHGVLRGQPAADVLLDLRAGPAGGDRGRHAGAHHPVQRRRTALQSAPARGDPHRHPEPARERLGRGDLPHHLHREPEEAARPVGSGAPAGVTRSITRRDAIAPPQRSDDSAERGAPARRRQSSNLNEILSRTR